MLNSDKTDGNITQKTPKDHVSHKQGDHNAMLDRISTCKTKQTCQKKGHIQATHYMY